MSIQALNWALSQDSIDNSGARFVLLILANFADENGFCYPTRETIARKTSMSVRAVQNHLNWLVAQGYISAETRRLKGNFTSNLFRLKNFASPGAASAISSAEFSRGDGQPSANPAQPGANSSSGKALPCADSAPDRVQNLHPTHHSETSQEEFKHHTQTPPSETAAAAVRENSEKPRTVESQFSLSECLRYVEICIGKGEPIQNPKGLASHLYRTGESDAFILAALYPEENAEREREFYGEPRKFTDEACTVCFGSRMEIVAGKGARPCPHCRNERGKSTGKEPLNLES